MRVLAVAQAFKETLDLATVAAALASGIATAGADPLVIAASDGGDGLLEALARSFERLTHHDVHGPLGEGIQVEVGWLSPVAAVVESRLVCGLSLVPPRARDPSQTTTRGLGELIEQLEAGGATEVYVGLGGSATMDGGTGMARAWGWVPLGADGMELPEGSPSLADLRSFREGRRPSARIRGLVDVRNQLTGPRGAWVYAGQKGASREVTQRLARGLDRLAEVAAREGHPDLASQPGTGAAGGLGFGIRFFAGGSLVPGATWVLERLGFDAALRGADLVICCEGSFDPTSLEGKLTGTVLEAASRAGVRAGLVAPQVTGPTGGALVETGGGRWSSSDLAGKVTQLVRKAMSTQPRV